MEAREFYNKRIKEEPTIGSVQLMEEYAKHIIEINFCDGSLIDFDNMTKDEKEFRTWLKDNYGIQDYNNYSSTQAEELAIQYAHFKQNCTKHVVSGICEHPWDSVIGDGEMKPAKCLKCGEYITNNGRS